MARILVVDDEHNVRSMIRLALEYVGHEVAVAADGPEGLEKFGDGTGWDLALLDQRMPDMEGMHVLREMLGRNPEARVVIITAFGTVDLAVEAMKSGATDFLRKPFTPEVLRGAVQAALTAEPAPARETPPAAHHPAVVRVTYNGFRIARAVSDKLKKGGEALYRFDVFGPDGQAQTCTVVLSPAVVAEIGREEAGVGFCEQALTNYLWQNAELPPSGELRLEELSADLRRWLKAYRESASKLTAGGAEL